MIQDCIDQARMIENGIARFHIAQEIDQRNLIALRTRQRAHDEIEIGGGKPRPTIRSDHRDLIMPDGRAYGKSDIFSHGFTRTNFPFKPTVHLNYEETVLPMKDGSSKLKDFPAALGGSGDTLPE